MLASRVILNVRKAASQGEFVGTFRSSIIGSGGLRFRERIEESMDFAGGVEMVNMNSSDV